MPESRSANSKPQDRRTAQAAAAAAAAAVAVGAPAPNPAAAAPSPKRVAQMVAVVAGLLAQFAEKRAASEQAFLLAQLAKRTTAPTDIEKVMAEERVRGAEFERLSQERVRRDLQVALSIPDAAKREAAVRGIMQREQVYARFRAEAMAARSFAAVDRMVLRRESPSGAFWLLDPTVKEHTAGCLIMGGRFWGWAILDRVHPPRHAGCPCRLISYGEAVRRGLMRPGDVLDVDAQEKAAAGVVMEAAGGIVGFAQKAYNEALHPRDRDGQWKEKLGGLQAGGWVRHGGVTFKDRGHGAVDVQGPGGRGDMVFSHDAAVKLAGQAVDAAAQAQKGKGAGLEDPEAFAKVFDGFEHAGVKVHITHAERVGEAGGKQGTEVSGDLIADGRVVGYIVRNISSTDSGLGADGKQGGQYVYHHELRLEPEYHRRGFATALQEHSEKAYRAAGVKEIHLTAQDAGTVVWAKRGFEPRPTLLAATPADAVRGWGHLVDDRRIHATDEERAQLRKLVEAGDIAKLAASPVGQKLLAIFGTWEGRKVLAPVKAAA